MTRCCFLCVTAGKQRLYRADPHMTLLVALNSQTVLSQSERGKTFLSAAPELSIRMFDQWTWNLRGEIPITEDRRFDWRVGAGLGYYF